MEKDDSRELNELLKQFNHISKNSKRPIVAGNWPGTAEEADSRPEEKLKGLVQWTTSDSKRFIPASQTQATLPSGAYEIMQASGIGIYFEMFPVKIEGLLRFPQTNSERVVQEIQLFWDREKIFREYGLTHKRGVILWGPPGCHAAGTEIRMFDGSKKKVEDVVVGDLLIGPDSNPRKVLELKRGVDKMYRVTPENGDSFVVNGHHIFNLVDDHGPLNITLNDFMLFNKSDQCFFNLHRTKGILRTGIKNIEPLGDGEYFGFILSGDHLYLTADYMVHHNSGKSSVIQLIMKDVIERNGIVVKFTNPILFMEGMRILREIEPEKPVVVLMEDIDSILQAYSESEVLNILDGVNHVDKCCFLASTNYPELLGPRIVNRPSRFDKRFKIGHPNAESRELYLKHIIGDKIKELNININKWVKDTDGFSIAHLKELFTAVVILGDSYEEAIDTLGSMRDNISSMHDEESMMGYRRK